MRTYEEIYNEAVASDRQGIVEEIRGEAYHAMMCLPDYELFEILQEANPNANLDIVFLYNDEAINSAFESPAEALHIVKNVVGTPDFDKEFLVRMEVGSEVTYQTVDRICDVECGWDDVFDTVMGSGFLWRYFPPESHTLFDDFVMQRAEKALFGETTYCNYCKDVDVTYIMHETPVKIECIGWYFGEPREEYTREYGNGDMVAYK